jgi:peptide/nickel transport system substrate-binding protein
MKFKSILTAVLVLAVAFVGGLGIGAEEPKYGGTVVIALPSEPKTLDPITYPDIYSAAVIIQVFEPLIWMDTKLSPTNQKLVESWETPDDVTYIFHLKKGVKFHDGHELTAEDVKFTLDSVMDPELASPRIHEFEKIESVEIIDDYTIKVVLKEPHAPFLVDVMPIPIVPKHYVEEVGWEEFSRNPIGTGPYKFVEWKSGDYIKLEANKDYWGKPAYIEEVTFRFIPEEAVGVMAMKAGEIDFLYEVPGEDLEPLEETPGVKVGTFKGLNYRFIAMNCGREPFDDVRVRQAINYAIDTYTIVELWHPLATPATGPIPPYNWAYTGDVRTYPRDIEKAKELLAEAGYPDGFEITLLIPPGTRSMEEAVIYQAQLSEAGIKMNIEQLEWGVFLDKLFAKDFDMLRVGWTGPHDPNGYIEKNHSESGWNFFNYSNPEIDVLIEAAAKTTDIKERKRLYARIQQILAEDVPMVYIFHEERARAYDENLGGLTQWIEANGFGPLAQLSEWYWKEKE